MYLTRATMLLLSVLSSGPHLSAEGHNPLLPRPQEIQYGRSRLPIAGLDIGFAARPTREDRFAAEELASGLRSRANAPVPVSGSSSPHRTIVLNRTGSGPDLPQPDEQPGPDSREAYTIKVTSDGAEIRAKSSAGLFYGVQTLLQLAEGSGAASAIPEVEIHDWPSLAYRGTMVDMSHGPLPTEEEIRRQIDFLSRWKDNQYFFYSETSIEMQGYPLVTPKARFTSEQVRRIIDYARDRHMDVVPCVELYGHLHDLFHIERYADLAVVPHGQDFNALEPRVMNVVSDWVDQLAQLFPSPFMHIGFDEPYDLQKSSELSKVPPEKIYLDQLIRVVKLVQAHGKHVLFWADMQNVLQKHPEIIPQLPPGLIAIPWHDFLEMDYSPWLAPLAAHHIPEFASTYIHNCLSIFPDFNQTFLIIDGILATARKYGASGMLINLWTDSNQDLYRMALAGMAYGAVAPWQSGPMAREQFFSDYARIVYPPALAVERIDHALALKGDPYSLSSLYLGAEMLDYAGMRYIDALEMAEAWQHMGARPSRRQVDSELHEFCNGCLVHYAAGDLMDAATELREDYRAAWLAEYTPYRLGASLGKFDREYLYWYGFSRWLRRLESGFRDGDTLPPLESYHSEY